VVGPAGEEIHVDKHGRVKIQFHWDREGKKNETSSCWVRVSSAWAGKGWGGISTPRIGQEVLVDFIEGDPDRPVIVGRLYNAEQTPPYTLPAAGTQSGIKSRSSKGGGTDNFNEIRLEDKKGEEMFFMQAEKDHEVNVKHDRKETVGNDETITIKGNRTETVEKDEKITIKGARTEDVTKDETVKIKGKRDHAITKDDILAVTGNQTVKVTGDQKLEVTKNINVESKIQINVKANAGIEFKVGGSTLKITPASIELKAPMIKLEAQALAEIKGAIVKAEAQGILQAKGAIAQINADGILMLKGALTMIN
jgi:type VI secretion system secreted protein VgrG